MTVAEQRETGSRCGRCAGRCDTCQWIEEQLAAMVAPGRPGSGNRDRPSAPRSFPVTELERAMGARSASHAASVLRVSMSTMRRLRSTGLTVWQADTYACRAGLHPGLVWSTWWES